MNRADRDPIKQDNTSIKIVKAQERNECRQAAAVDSQLILDNTPFHKRQVLEQDVIEAVRIQRRLLPPATFTIPGYEIGYHYAPAGPVSGDYCDLMECNNRLLFLFGDVSGKGISASLLMSHLHGTFRTLAATNASLEDMVEAANRIFSQSTHRRFFATLIVGCAHPNGTVDLINAGHPPVLHLHKAGVGHKEASAVPFGMFSNSRFPVHRFNLHPDDMLLLYTDGVTEYRNSAGLEYGISRLTKTAVNHCPTAPGKLIAGCLSDLSSFSMGMEQADDLTLLAIRRTALKSPRPPIIGVNALARNAGLTENSRPKKTDLGFG